MKGIQLCEQYFNEVGRSMLEEKFAPYLSWMAAGLCGYGSECFGYDDELSRDHDYGAGFQIWLPKELYNEIGEKLQQEYLQLRNDFGIYQSRNTTANGQGRVGVFCVSGFYESFTGYEGLPPTLYDWAYIPEEVLAVVTNGKVFMDNFGEFSAIRQGYQAFYPEDVRLKKLSLRLAMMAQAGQYNLPRSIKRGECGALYMSEHEFVKAAVSAVYLLNKKYTPFYKWAIHGMKDLQRLSFVKDKIEQLFREREEKKPDIIEDICRDVLEELKIQKLTDSEDTFLENQKNQVLLRIEDDTLRNM